MAPRSPTSREPARHRGTRACQRTLGGPEKLCVRYNGARVASTAAASRWFVMYLREPLASGHVRAGGPSIGSYPSALPRSSPSFVPPCPREGGSRRTDEGRVVGVSRAGRGATRPHACRALQAARRRSTRISLRKTQVAATPTRCPSSFYSPDRSLPRRRILCHRLNNHGMLAFVCPLRARDDPTSVTGGGPPPRRTRRETGVSALTVHFRSRTMPACDPRTP
ncbi:hypothetical protein B0H15DRAFT_957788 [Mycena belliarum]|uniref:Uncharacterized protein n=1 Tax=Mycena belliarum TaxID=1033014 RepID=A0AAD6XI53_9AGAR|nr:hypothetical protein B0H15DRAFT_957788 [Mycena belliae]